MELNSALIEWKKLCIPAGPSPSAGVLGVTPGQVAEIRHATQPKKTQATEPSMCCLGSITKDKTSESEIYQNCPVSTTERKERLKKTKKEEKDQIHRHLCENSRNTNICTVRSQRREERGWG